MAIVYNKYINNRDHTWYDSSNVYYSECFDNVTETKVLKVVFKQGRTYLYKDVTVDDYLMFKNSQSTGSAINTHIIKKYKGVRLSDTEIGVLDKLKEDFINDGKITEEAFTNLAYNLEMNNENGEFRLILNGKPIYEGIENQVSIVRLLRCMNINYSTSDLKNKITSEEDFIKE